MAAILRCHRWLARGRAAVGEARLISDYLSQLAGALSFDRAVSRCVVQEVEDHLRQAAAANQTHDRSEAERRAIADFGDADVLAAQFAVVALARRTRKVGVVLVLAIAAVLAAMKARTAWYAVLRWTINEEARDFGAIVISIDRFAFWLAVVMGAGALLYIVHHRRRAALHPGCRAQLRGAFLLSGCAAVALA